MSLVAAVKVALIGDGGISHAVRAELGANPTLNLEVAGILTRRPDPADPLRCADTGRLLACRPAVVVECASHQALADHGESVLRAGVSLVAVSIGALADPALYGRLRTAAVAGNARLILVPGAIGGIDALAAARFGGLERVCYRGRKPPRAWSGTPAGQLIDLASISEPTVFYRGSACEAALRYPKNANVAATVALAGLGFERTEVELVADPTVERNVHELSFVGRDGRFDMRMEGVPSPENAKTSMLTAHSVVRALAALTSPVTI